VLYFSLMLFIVSLVAIAFADTTSPGFVPALLSVVLNGFTALGSALCIYALCRNSQRK